MTAINVFFGKDRVSVLTDSAVYFKVAGKPIGFTQKALPIPALDCVVAVRGTAFNTGWLVQSFLQDFHSFDHMLATCEYVFHQGHQKVVQMVPEGEKPKDYEIIVAGYSRIERRFHGFMFSTRTEPMLQPLDDAWNVAPTPSEDEWSHLVRTGIFTPDWELAGRFNPMRHGIPILEAQRRTKIAPIDCEDAAPGCIVGGNVCLTEVTAEGITQKIIHRWNDEVGQPFRVKDRAERTAA